jgi:hypothetical protein
MGGECGAIEPVRLFLQEVRTMRADRPKARPDVGWHLLGSAS